MGTVGYIRETIRETQDPIKESIYSLIECIDKLRPCGIVSEELEGLASAVELLESVNDSLEEKLRELRTFDSNQTSDDYRDNLEVD